VKTVPVGSYPSRSRWRAGRSTWSTGSGARTRRATSPTAGSRWCSIRGPASVRGTVSVVDVGSGSVTAQIDVGLHPSRSRWDAARQRLYGHANSERSRDRQAHGPVAGTLDVRLVRKAPLAARRTRWRSARRQDAVRGQRANNAVCGGGHGGGRLRSAADPTAGTRRRWRSTATSGAVHCQRLRVRFAAPTPGDRKGRSYRDRGGDRVGGADRARRRAGGLTRQLCSATTARASRPPPARSRGAIPCRWTRGRVAHPARLLHHQGESHLRPGVRRPRAGQRRSVARTFRARRDANHHALAERYVPARQLLRAGDQSALGHRWCTQGYASDWLHKYGNGRNDANPMLFAPRIFCGTTRGARAHGAELRRARTVAITPESAGWLDIYRD